MELPMADERKERCETCRFWDERNVDAGCWGSCRRFPPVKHEFEQFDKGGMAKVGEWPDTQEKDWCGEWQPKPER